MKNQYTGDIGDYGKYGLLRHLAEKGVRVGVNWYLTEDDPPGGPNDGKHRDYLKEDEVQGGNRQYDKDLFDKLAPLADKNNDDIRNVCWIEKQKLIPNAVYYHKQLAKTSDIPTGDRASFRKEWHEKAMAKLQDATLIFADPDNGVIYRPNATRKNDEKYATLSELMSYYCEHCAYGGKDVVVYCQRGHRKEPAWKKLVTQWRENCPDAKQIVLTFHRGTQRSYVFFVHSERYEEYNGKINDFLAKDWGTKAVDDEKNIPFKREL